MIRSFFSPLVVSFVALFWVASVAGQDSDDLPPKPKELDSGLISTLKFRSIGPAFMSGRVVDIVVDPVKRSTWYVAAASGGVWKTDNAGVTWQPIFDHYGSYSIGCLAIDPHDRKTIWVGTGENNSQRSVAYGDGIYKSTDGGATFQKMGLGESEHIGKIVIHPDDSDTVFVAAQGPLWRAGGDRGLFKTTDGGKTWNNILEVDKDTGVNEVHLDPQNPQIMYATTYQRRRHTWVLIDGGPGSAIYKSTDGGKTWKKINRGLPGGDLGRIGMAISPINPEVVYAIVEATGDQSGFYRSTNRGESWTRMSGEISVSPQYYQELFASPHEFDRVYSMDTYVRVTEDGGKTFSNLGQANKHVDNHAMVIDPEDAEHLIFGCDGGVYETWDGGKHYDFKANLPIAQFYKVAVSYEKPFFYVYGGTQDNATQGGPSQTRTRNGIRNCDWFTTVFGDGFEPAVDPEDPDTVYSQWQYGGLVRFNRQTGERVDIKPQHVPGLPPLRWNWDSALMISPHNPHRLYYGSQILFRSDDRGDRWKAISPDLSRNLDRNKLKVMGRVWGIDAVAKNDSTSLYGTIVSLSESPLVEGLIYVGTDDGMFQVTEDGGKHWRAVSKFGSLEVPEFGYINDIEADQHDPDTVYVAINNHKRGDFKPYLVRSTDRGKTWTDISGDLPERGSVYAFGQDHEKPELFFCGTEFGCFTSVDGGKHWLRLASGLPTIAIRDLEIQREEDSLVLASFGRGFYVLDDYSPLRRVSKEMLKANTIMPIKTGKIFPLASPLSGSGKAYQGASYFVAPNPKYGVAIFYHLAEDLKTKKAIRQAKDRKAARANKDVPYPTWEELKAEEREVGPRIILTIRDRGGRVVRRLTGSPSKGLHQVQWDLRYAKSGDRMGALALPGKYTVDLVKLVDGKTTELVRPTPFKIEPLMFAETSPSNQKKTLQFIAKVQKLDNGVTAATSVIRETRKQLKAIRTMAQDSPKLGPEWESRVRALEERLKDIDEMFTGDPTRPRWNEVAAPGISQRARTVIMGAMGSTEGPTQTHRQQFKIAAADFEKAAAELKRLVEKEIPRLNRELDKAGAPWTPGRKIPKIE